MWRALRGRVGAAWAHAKQGLLAGATVAVDRGIASLQWLRQHALDAEQADEESDDGDLGARRARRAAKTNEGEEAAEESAAPEPRRRLRRVLVYVLVLLLGILGGSMSAHKAFEHVLDQRAAELRRQQVDLAKYSKSTAELQQELDEQKTWRADAETRLSENQKMLSELRRERAEVAAKLAATRSRRARYARPGYGGAGSGAGTVEGLSPTGDCTLEGGNVAAVLSDCIAEMNRR